MAMDFEQVKAAFPTTVPMVGTLGIEFEDLAEQRCVMRMRDQAEYHNHVGGLHAGAMFTLAESASGALVFAAFGDRFADATPLAVEATIRYLKLAKGDVRAAATMAKTPAEILAVLDGGQRPEFTVEIELTTDDGTVTGAMSVLWTLKLIRR